MKNTCFRTFIIPRADGRVPFKFAVHTLADSTVQVTRISPYDETEYHWAYHPGTEDAYWGIYREGNFVARSRDFYDGAEVTPEQIAEELLNCDEAAKLERRGGIW